MRTFNYKKQTYTCEIVHKNTNLAAKSKCVRIITEQGIRNIYTIADGYTKPVAYSKNTIVLSDIVIGKAFSILGLMNGGAKFVFTKDTVVKNVSAANNDINTTTNISSVTMMYRVIDVNTGAIAMFSSEVDVVGYCIGRTVKVDKIQIDTGISNICTNVANDDVPDTPDEAIVEVEKDDVVAPVRKGKSNYTKSRSSDDIDVSPTELEPIASDTIPDSSSDKTVDKAPTRRKRG